MSKSVRRRIRPDRRHDAARLCRVMCAVRMGNFAYVIFGFPEQSTGIIKQLHITVDLFRPTRLFLING